MEPRQARTWTDLFKSPQPTRRAGHLQSMSSTSSLRVSQSTASKRPMTPPFFSHKSVGSFTLNRAQPSPEPPSLTSPPECVADGNKPYENDARPLHQLMDVLTERLPIVLKVYDGLHRSASRYPLLTGVRLSHLEVVSCLYKGEAFSIPLNTDLRFAVLYERDDATDVQAIIGKEFTVDELYRNHRHPKVVSALQDWESDAVQVEKGEIFVLKGPNFDSCAPEISAFSMRTKSAKTLPISCPVHFTTAARTLCLHLTDIVAYVPDLFPCRACVERYDHGTKCYPANILLMSMLTRVTVLKCVRAEDDGSTVVLNIPVDLPFVRVTVETETPALRVNSTAADVTDSGNGTMATVTVTTATDVGAPVFTVIEHHTYADASRNQESVPLPRQPSPKLLRPDAVVDAVVTSSDVDEQDENGVYVTIAQVSPVAARKVGACSPQMLPAVDCSTASDIKMVPHNGDTLEGYEGYVFMAPVSPEPVYESIKESCKKHL